MKKYSLALAFTLFAGTLLPLSASADTIFITAPIVADTLWSSENVYVIDSNFSIPAGVTLTVDPGTVIKAKNTGPLGAGILGNLNALGTEALPIYFTSWSDDSVGGDVNADGPSVGAPGAWQGLYFKPGSVGRLDHIDLRYAGYGSGSYGHLTGIENDGGNVEIKNSNIHYNYANLFDWVIGPYRGGQNILQKSGTLSVIDSTIDNSGNGINIESGMATISGNIIKNHEGYSAGYGVYLYGGESLALFNNTFVGNRRTASVSASTLFTHGGNTSSDSTNRGFEIGGPLSGDATFSSGDLPYIVKNIVVGAGQTLTLNPGVILKMDDYFSTGAMTVYGRLLARGTPDEKIYITSLRDDTVGGDTNGNLDANLPAPRNWNAIFLENGSSADFDETVVRYGGYNYNGEYLPGVAAAIYNRGAEFSIANSLFERNAGTSIFQDAGSTEITGSKFTNGDTSLWSRGGEMTVSQSSFEDNFGMSVYNQDDPTIDARGNWWGDPSGPRDISTSTPTGLGDTISGSILYLPFLPTPPGSEVPQTIDPVIIIPGIMGSDYSYILNRLVIDPVLHTYDNLIATLEANGYEEGVDLFTFPYEWRDSNVITANLLKDKISEVKQICGCSKVDLVAHSMGGLAAREYIQSGQYQNDVDQLIFLGTPHKGSAEAYLTWEAGEFSSDVFRFLVQIKLLPEMIRGGYFSLTEYIQNRPISSIQELLPVFDYLKDKSTGITRTYPTNYPRNIFLEALNANTPDLLNSGVKITNIVGEAGTDTLEKIRVVGPGSDKWTHGQPDGFYENNGDKGLERGVGDGTVTLYSAKSDFVNNAELPSTHRALPTQAEGNIVKILTGKDSIENVNKGLIRNMLVIQLHSPIDVVVTAPDGKKVGKNFLTGQVYDQIPLAFYSGYQSDDEFITIPDPLAGEYKVELQGTDEGGRYGVSISYVSETALATTETVGTTEPGQITSLNIEFDTANPENISTEKEVTPDTLLNDINGAYDLGWIKDKKTRDSLLKQVNAAIKFSKKIEKVKERLPDGSIKEKRVEKFSVKVNKILAKLFEKELEILLKKGKITQEAYDLIFYDVEYLINN